MKKLLLLALIGLTNFVSAQSPYSNSFQSAYTQYPFVTDGILEAVAFTQTRIRHIESDELQGCSGIPQALTVMGLFEDGKNYFSENLKLVSTFSQVPIPAIKFSPETAIQAYAATYDILMNQACGGNLSERNNHEKIKQVLAQLTEIPDSGIVNEFALESQQFEIFKFLKKAKNQTLFNFPDHHYNLASIFGSNYTVLASSKVNFTDNSIETASGDSFTTAKSAQYGPAIWNPAPTCNYSSRSGTAISHITIHTIQGSYAGAISWSQNCSSNVSFHYVIRSSDGQVTQMVLEEDKAWHVGSENPYTIGYEHEGYVNDPVWYTTAMYNASADLSRDIINSGYGISGLRTYYGNSSTGTNTLGGCTHIKGHQHYANQSHTDPGINWDWPRYYHLINNAPTIQVLSSTTGTITDSGGNSGDYQNDERELWRIAPAGAGSVTLNFSSFDTEQDWDYLFIYDGANVTDPLIGQYSGTTSPGTITSSGGALLIEFRSDCATQGIGWEATWTSTGIDVVPPTTSVDPDVTWKTQNFGVTFSDFDDENLGETFYQIRDRDAGQTEWDANGNFGFSVDAFNVIGNNWNSQVGTWNVTNDEFVMSDNSEQNSNAYKNVTQNNTESYLYHWQQKISGTSGSRRAGIHFFCDDATLPNRGNSYFMYLRAEDNKCQIYKVENDTWTLMTNDTVVINIDQNYDVKLTFDPVSGWIKTYVDNALVSSWQDNSPHSSGNSVSLRSGGCTAIYDNFKVYKSRGNSVNVSVGSTNEVRYQADNGISSCMVHSIVQDATGNWSNYAFEEFLVDWTPPTLDFVNDGTGTDISTFAANPIAANYSIEDVNSNIDYFEYAVGIQPLDNSVVDWTNNSQNTAVSEMIPFLVQGETYFISVRAINNAGLESTFYSNGQTYDNTSSLEELSDIISIYPNPTSNYLNIQMENNFPYHFSIFDMNGRLVVTKKEVIGTEIIDVNSYSNGTYSLIIQQDSQIVKKLFVVE